MKTALAVLLAVAPLSALAQTPPEGAPSPREAAPAPVSVADATALAAKIDAAAAELSSAADALEAAASKGEKEAAMASIAATAAGVRLEEFYGKAAKLRVAPVKKPDPADALKSGAHAGAKARMRRPGLSGARIALATAQLEAADAARDLVLAKVEAAKAGRAGVSADAVERLMAAVVSVSQAKSRLMKELEPAAEPRSPREPGGGVAAPDKKSDRPKPAAEDPR